MTESTMGSSGKIRYDVRVVKGSHYLRGWIYSEEGQLWHVAHVTVLADKDQLAEALKVLEEDIHKRYLGREQRHWYALPWTRNEMAQAKGNGGYMLLKEDLEGAGNG